VTNEGEGENTKKQDHRGHGALPHPSAAVGGRARGLWEHESMPTTVAAGVTSSATAAGSTASSSSASKTT